MRLFDWIRVILLPINIAANFRNVRISQQKGYYSKILTNQIAIPNSGKLKCISWSQSSGYIACGGCEGLLKILKLDTQSDAELLGITAPNSLKVNQTLDGHEDESGLIIVWMNHKEVWYEEMINNRNKSLVHDMKWDKAGDRICLVYEDGAAIVGSVNGNRLWGGDLKLGPIHFIEWCPSGDYLLFGLKTGDVFLFDDHGNQHSKIDIHCLTDITDPNRRLVSLQWYTSPDSQLGCISCHQPNLSICYAVGRCQLMRGCYDTDPVIIDTGICITCSAWNSSGSLFVVGGCYEYSNTTVLTENCNDSRRDFNVVQFYNPRGDNLYTLCLPGQSLTSCSWEGAYGGGGGSSSLRLAITVDAFIYFAHIRPCYKWTFCSTGVVVYATEPTNPNKTTINSRKWLVKYWELKTSKVTSRKVDNLLFICGSEDCVCLISRSEDDAGCLITLTNSSGASFETKSIPFEPKLVALTSNQLVAATDSTLYSWQFFNLKKMVNYQSNKVTSSSSIITFRQHGGVERLCHIDQHRRQEEESKIIDNSASTNEFLPTSSRDDSTLQEEADSRRVDWTLLASQTSDSIASLCLAKDQRTLLVGRSSGLVMQFRLPDLWLINSFHVPSIGEETRLVKLAVNCDLTCLGVIDTSGYLTLHRVDRDSSSTTTSTNKCHRYDNFRLKDTWDIKFAVDEPNRFVVMEKTKLVIFENAKAEPAKQTSSYLCSFEDLCVTGVHLDELITRGDVPTNKHVMHYPVKIFRDCEELLTKGDLKACLKLISNNSHPRLQRLVADYCLQRQKLDSAEHAFAINHDYAVIQLVKRVQRMPDKLARKKAIDQYLKGRAGGGDSLHNNLSTDRLIHGNSSFTSSSLDDSESRDVCRQMGDQCWDRLEWKQAAKHYAKCGDVMRQSEALYQLSDLEGLVEVVGKNASSPSADTSHLSLIASRLAGLGLVDQAVDVLVKINQIDEAIRILVEHNRWSEARQLASRSDASSSSKNRSQAVMQKFEQVVGSLDADKELAKVVELYARAGMFLIAAKLIFAASSALDGLLMEEQARTLSNSFDACSSSTENTTDWSDKRRLRSQKSAAGGHLPTATSSPAANQRGQASLTQGSELELSRMFDQPWRGAEACHFFLLAQRQLLAGTFDRASRTAALLGKYEDILSPTLIYSLIALCSIHSGELNACSNALTRFKALSQSNENGDVVLLDESTICEIFTRYQVECEGDASSEHDQDLSFLERDLRIPICVVIGQPITDYQFWMCPTCKHSAFEREIAKHENCPMCHFPIQ